MVGVHNALVAECTVECRCNADVWLGSHVLQPVEIEQLLPVQTSLVVLVFCLSIGGYCFLGDLNGFFLASGVWQMLLGHTELHCDRVGLGFLFLQECQPSHCLQFRSGRESTVRLLPVRFLISFLQSSMSLQMGVLVKFVIAAWESHKMTSFENVDGWYDSCLKVL